MRATLTASIAVVMILAGAVTSYTFRGEPQAPQATASPKTTPATASPASATRTAGKTFTDAELTEAIHANCAVCHSDRLKEQYGNVSLEHYDVASATKDPALSERMIRKVRAGMMPPPNAPKKPAPELLTAMAQRIENKIDAAWALNPNPGTRSFQRLNRPEYQAAIKDLLGLDIDPANWLPLDTMSGNFDNTADAQFVNATVLDAYLNAAEDISRMALGDGNAPDVDTRFATSKYLSQNPADHVPGTPYGTRGGIAIDHVFPADGEYIFSLTFSSGGSAKDEKVDVSVDGVQIALLSYQGRAGAQAADGVTSGNRLGTPPLRITAGEHHVAAAFVKQQDGPLEDTIRPHDWSLAGGGSGGDAVTRLPHLRELFIKGPSNITNTTNDNVMRAKVFVCRPTVAAEERPCAKTLITKLATKAFRRTLTATDTDELMKLYDAGSERGGFELGIRETLSGILSSPNFVLKTETTSATPVLGQKNNYRISDFDLATRLSFFLWGAPPDDQLETAAAQKKLSAPGELEKQVRRMLADPRADALGTRFAAQWLHLSAMYKVNPDPNYFPNYDQLTADAMKTETVMFFNNLVRQNRSFLEAFSANYTFINERLARHYGIPNVSGEQFRKVQYPDSSRRGILGQGSIEVLTSYAGRTSPVQRGKWVMSTLMGTPPPNPPPNVPPFDDTAGGKNGEVLTTRMRMEIHRANPTCSRCHSMIDPIGLAMDNFDPTGKWRTRENGVLLDTHGTFYDGTPIASVGELEDALLKRPVPLIRTFVQNLMEYAVGRPMEYYDQPAIRKIVKSAEPDKYPMVSLIMGVVQSEAFQMKRIETPATETAAKIGRN